MFAKKPSTIRFQLTCLVVVCVLPVWLMAGFLVFQVYSSKLHEVHREILDPARAITKIVDRELSSAQSALMALATSSSLAKENFAEVHRETRELLRSYPGADIIVADINGQQRVNSYRPYGTPLPKRNNLEMVQGIFASGRPIVSDLYFGAITKRPLIAIDVPVFRDGKVVYDLSMTFPVDRFSSLLSRQKLPAGWYSTIIDRNRVIVGRTKDSGKYVGRQITPELRRSMDMASDGTTEVANLAGIPVFIAFCQSSVSGWAVSVAVPKAVVMSGVYNWMWWAVGGAFTISLLSIILAMGMAQRIARSIQSLVNPALSIGRGEALADIGFQSVQETVEVAHALVKASELVQDNAETLRRQQGSLQQSEERYRMLVEFSPDAILLHHEGVFAYVNSAACRLFGARGPEELIGTQVMATVHPEYREMAFELCAHGGSNERASQLLEGKALRLDGTPIDVEVVGTHMFYRGRSAVQVILRDITERKRAEKLLKQSEQALRTLMEAMPVGVALVSGDGSVEYINGRVQEMFGYSLAEIPSLTQWYESVYPDPQQRARIVADLDAQLAEAKAEGTPVLPMESDLTCRDGSVRHMIINRQLSGDRRIVIFTDITERESLQNEILKAQKLESLGVLAGGIAHDFNNILTGILGNISFARMFLDQTHKSFLPLNHAEKASLRAAALATQLLTFAQGGAPVKKSVSIQPIVEETVSLALRGANVKGVLRIPDGLSSVEADEGQISQAFHNVVLNAVQAMPGGGTLTVDAENVRLRPGNAAGLPPGGYVKLSFADEGCGIPEGAHQKIFDPYFTTKPGGSGLGLASVHSIFTKHGGRVEGTSLPGKGAVFTFWLPSSGTFEVPEVVPMEPEIAVHRVGEPVLVMDDESLILTLTSEILGHLGYLVTTCTNGEEAIALYRKAKAAGTPFLAAVMDLTVPGAMGGKEAAVRILEIDPAARLIVSSGYSNDPVMAEYGKYGFCAAIAKPYKGEDLARILSWCS